jgi:cold-inducible RNA-binding protein
VKKIYVGNFSFQMTEAELRALFQPYGTVESASLATDRDSGRSRGFGFVSMTNDDEAEKAMAGLNGKESGGRALTINEARSQVQRGAFREGGVAIAAHGSAGEIRHCETAAESRA